jgi:hypothetical protein
MVGQFAPAAVVAAHLLLIIVVKEVLKEGMDVQAFLLYIGRNNFITSFYSWIE